jgi:hypothetical protein
MPVQSQVVGLWLEMRSGRFLAVPEGLRIISATGS